MEEYNNIKIEELIRGTVYEKEFSNIDSYSAEELMAKTEGIILKTKLLIQNTKPEVDFNTINKEFVPLEDILKLIKARPKEDFFKHFEVIKSNYIMAIHTYLFNEGVCNRVQNRRNDENIKLVKKSVSNEQFIQQNFKVKLFEDTKQLKVNDATITFTDTEFQHLKDFFDAEFNTILYKDMGNKKKNYSDYKCRINKKIRGLLPNCPDFIEKMTNQGYKISSQYKISKNRR